MATKKATKSGSKVSKGTGVSPILEKAATEVAASSGEAREGTSEVRSLPVLGQPLPAALFPDPSVVAAQSGTALPPMPAQPLLPVPRRVSNPQRRGRWDPATRQWSGETFPATSAVAAMTGPAAASASAVVGPVRKFNPTFDEPSNEVLEAQGRAINMRGCLGRAVQALLLAVSEVEQTEALVKARPEAAAEVERIGVSLPQAQEFRAAVLEVLERFKPLEKQEQGGDTQGKGASA